MMIDPRFFGVLFIAHCSEHDVDECIEGIDIEFEFKVCVN